MRNPPDWTVQSISHKTTKQGGSNSAEKHTYRMQARERHTIRTHLTIIADHVYGSNQESQGRWWNPFSWKTDAHGWSKRCSWPVYIGMTMALGVCSALSRLYNVERCTTLIGLVNGTDAVIATVGGSTAVMFDQWKRSEMVYWCVLFSFYLACNDTLQYNRYPTLVIRMIGTCTRWPCARWYRPWGPSLRL